MSTRTVLALHPFLAEGTLSLRVFREMRARGVDVTVAYAETLRGSQITPDPCADFAAAGRLLDLTGISPAAYGVFLGRFIRKRNVGLLVQIGAKSLYPILPWLKERFPDVSILDVLYNEFGHTVNHFLFEPCMDGVLVESRHMQRLVERASSKPSPGVELIESGVDLATFTPAPARAHRAELTVGYVGRMSPEKNPLGFVELCESLHASLPTLSFRMVGSGPIADDVQRRTSASSARAAIDFRGHAQDVLAAIRDLDVLVVPSTGDGRPQVIMEANACGIPVIAAPVGGIPEMIEDGRNGYCLRPKDAAAIAERLRKWTSSPERLAAIKKSARGYAEERFSRDRMMDRYEAVLRARLGA